MLVSSGYILISRERIESGEESDVCRIGCRSILDSVIGKRRKEGERERDKKRERGSLMDASRTREFTYLMFLFPFRENI